MEESKDFFLKTKPLKLFFRAAIPGGISMLASSFYIVFDTLFAGKMISTTALAALGLAMPLIIMNFALAELVGVGSSVPISIFLGKRQDYEANNYFSSAILLIMATGLFSGAIIFLSAPTFMRLMGAEGELLQYAVQYVRVYAVFSPLTPLMFALDNYLRISGRVKTSMALNIFSSAFTIGLEYLFVVVLKMDVVGAALGGSLGMLAVVFIALIMFAKGNLQLKYARPHFSKKMIIQIYKNGLAPFLTNISGRLFSVVMNIMLVKYSTEKGEAVAIYGILMMLAGIIEQILYGVADSLQPSLGYNYGAQKFDRVKTIEKYALIAGVSISLIGGIIIFAFPAPLSIPFLEDLALLGQTVRAIKILSLTYLFKWLGTVTQCFFMALEKPIPAMLISTASACVFPLILIPLLMPLALDGLWLNYPISACLTAILAAAVLLKMRKSLF